MRWSCLLTALAALALFVPLPVSAQEDTTPPELIDFTIEPTVFDAATGDVTLNFCVTVRDDLSGIAGGGFETSYLRLQGLSAGTSQETYFFGADPNGPLEQTICREWPVLAQFSPYGEWAVQLYLKDKVGNAAGYDARSTPSICEFGPCIVQNRSLEGAVDTDGDGVADVSDNCPDDSNAGQDDRDFDSIGDICDPFPFDRDNEQAQCEADLAGSQDDLAECQSAALECSSDLGAAQVQIAQLQTDLEARDATIEQLQTDLAQCQSDLATCEGPSTDCSDGLDNDGDGQIDYPADKMCGSPEDPSELAPPLPRVRPPQARSCGIGFELALILPVLYSLRRRRWTAGVAC